MGHHPAVARPRQLPLLIHMAAAGALVVHRHSTCTTTCCRCCRCCCCAVLAEPRTVAARHAAAAAAALQQGVCQGPHALKGQGVRDGGHCCIQAVHDSTGSGTAQRHLLLSPGGHQAWLAGRVKGEGRGRGRWWVGAAGEDAGRSDPC
jgi:hypothetical protein